MTNDDSRRHMFSTTTRAHHIHSNGSEPRTIPRGGSVSVLLFVYVSLLLHRPSRTSRGRHRAANRTEEQTGPVLQAGTGPTHAESLTHTSNNTMTSQDDENKQ